MAKIARTGAHHGSRAIVGEQASDYLVPRALKLRTGFAVSSLMLTVHPTSGSSASQRNSGVSRKIRAAVVGLDPVRIGR